jgi:uncharacterized protein YegP (UPF0339 family)
MGLFILKFILRTFTFSMPCFLVTLDRIVKTCSSSIGGIAMAKFELYKNRSGEFRWRLRADNNQIIASGEGYTTKAACKNGIESVKKNAPKAKVEDQT